MAKNNNISFLPHILGLFFWIIGPLVTYLAGDGELKKHSKKALNWQISLVIYSFISGILIIILVGFLLLIALWILNIIFSIIATIKASNGELWDYPMAIKFFK